MNAVIASYRRGVRTQSKNQMVVEIEGVNSREDATKLVGKKVSWVAPGAKKTTINGEVSSAHGGKGAVRVRFERGMPGQSLGTNVQLQ